MNNRRQRPIRPGRLSRMGQLGGLAAGMAGSLVSEGMRRWQRGESWDWQQQALTPKNLSRLGDRLSQMRGAAMKLGQLLSMDAGHLLPAELAQLLSGLRNDAHTMPLSQLDPLLTTAWGADWKAHFQRFSYHPIASASIGQVHEAVTHDGQHLAIKIQYPGVIQSIESDLDNVATLLRWSGLLPKQLDIAPLLEEAKTQLKLETDYQHEAQQLHAFSKQLKEGSPFVLPKVNSALSHSNILAMSFLPGQPIERLEGAPLSLRQHWVKSLFELFFQELLEFNLIQTDPNYANYLIDPSSHHLGLIDFGAVRNYPQAMAEAYRLLFKAVIAKDQVVIRQAAKTLGYLADDITLEQEASLFELFTLAAEPLTQATPFDFAASNIPLRLQEVGMRLSLEQGYWHTPPVNALLLHRKLGGLFLLAQRLKVQLNVAEIAAPYLTTNPAQA